MRYRVSYTASRGKKPVAVKSWLVEDGQFTADNIQRAFDWDYLVDWEALQLAETLRLRDRPFAVDRRLIRGSFEKCPARDQFGTTLSGAMDFQGVNEQL